jgi:hypothetical protein
MTLGVDGSLSTMMVISRQTVTPQVPPSART